MVRAFRLRSTESAGLIRLELLTMSHLQLPQAEKGELHGSAPSLRHVLSRFVGRCCPFPLRNSPQEHQEQRLRRCKPAQPALSSP